MALIGVNHRLTTAFRPQADGQTERINQVEKLPSAQLAYNTAYNEKELQEILIETDEEEGEIQSPPIYLSSYEDKVKKLKKKLRNLREQHNTLLDNAKNNAKIA
ncbi:uncharacterized protein FRV6_11868 [Fusarium oxysporum]|uniref:Uncharacterized protein n=1 Tax=Fusarium oxysporum TaxID=5507 RepID=A0A2H3TPT1_FUSOX|nr:uncharacterized protein FRV6_11868 [Fusarium oxysporum]